MMKNLEHYLVGSVKSQVCNNDHSTARPIGACCLVSGELGSVPPVHMKGCTRLPPQRDNFNASDLERLGRLPSRTQASRSSLQTTQDDSWRYGRDARRYAVTAWDRGRTDTLCLSSRPRTQSSECQIP
eukprot:3515586-Amphidinium_carterae.2